MDLNNNETRNRNEVQFAASMRHRSLPRTRRRKKTTETPIRPVGILDPLTGEITIPDEEVSIVVPPQTAITDSSSEAELPDFGETIPAVPDNNTEDNVFVDSLENLGFTGGNEEDLFTETLENPGFAHEEDEAAFTGSLKNPGFADEEEELAFDDLFGTSPSADRRRGRKPHSSRNLSPESNSHKDVPLKYDSSKNISSRNNNSAKYSLEDVPGYAGDIEAKVIGDIEAEPEVIGDIETEPEVIDDIETDPDDTDEDDADTEEDGIKEKTPTGGLSLFRRFRNRRSSGKQRKKAGKNSGSDEEDEEFDDEDFDFEDTGTDGRETEEFDADGHEMAEFDADDLEIDDLDTEDSGTDERGTDTPEAEEPEVIHNPVIRYDPDLTYGLTAAEVSDREAEGLINVTVRKGQKTVRQIVLSHTLTYFNLLNIVLGILVATTGQWKNMLFLGIIVGNSAIGIFQELKVKSLIDNLTVITAARVTALRDGQEQEIPVDGIVVDDIVKLAPGDQVVTDGRVFDCRGLEVNESMLTGESQPVRKSDSDSILSGSFIVAGTACMRVDKVGNESYASQLVAKASHKKRASSEMQRAIGRIIKVVSVIIIPVGLLLYQSQLVANNGVFANAIIRTVSGIIGMIPEGLVLLTSVSFIIGVGRLANKKALVQEMPSIESLARADIICTDKTGTITTGELRVSEVLPMGRMTRDAVMDIMAHINSAFTDANVTQDALNAAFGKSKGWAVRSIIPFSSERKFRAVSFDEHGDYVLGAPEFIVPNNKAALEIVDSYSQQGYRVLLLGRSKGIDPDTGEKGAVTPIAAIIISDVIKEDAKETFAYFAKAGVDIKVLSGDNPLTVSSVALKAGVAHAERYIDATKLPDDPAALQQAVMKYSVFGRVKPEQKQAFIKAWQAGGKTVAMVGDGVNDVLAIKDADCGIAMASGSEAAKQAAHIVLMDSDFSSMKDIVKEGKTIIANIERVSSLYLTKTIYSCLLCVIFILLKKTYPFTTLQMGLINLCGIGMPSFLLTLEQQENVTSDGFLKHVLQTALPAALTMVTSMLIVQVLNGFFPWSTDIFSTFNLMLGGLVSLLVVASVCWPLAPYRKFVLAVSAIVFLGAVILLPHFYDMHSIFMWWSLLLVPLGIVVMILIALYSRLTSKAIIEFNRFRQNMEARKKRYDPDIY